MLNFAFAQNWRQWLYPTMLEMQTLASALLSSARVFDLARVILDKIVEHSGSSPLKGLEPSGETKFVPRIDWSNEKHKKTLFKVAWVLCILFLLTISAILIFLGHLIFQSYKPGILFASVLWSIFFGVTALVFLPPKAVVTIFGGLLGIGISETASAAGLISKANQEFTKIAVELGAIGQTMPPATAAAPFIVLLVWTSAVIMTLLCLPAFFSKD